MSIAYHDDLHQTFLPNDFRFDYNRIVPVSLSLSCQRCIYLSRDSISLYVKYRFTIIDILTILHPRRIRR